MKLLVILFILKSYARVKIFIYFWNLWFSTFFLMFQAVTWRVRKNFLHFSKWNFFTLCLKNPVLFLGEPLRSSISSCFHFFMFPFLLFLHFLRGFYCWLHFFTSLFLHFLSGILFLCCYHECYRFEIALFTLRRFLPYTLLPAFIKVSLGPSVLPWRFQGFPLRVETQTCSICLFESRSARQLYDK